MACDIDALKHECLVTLNNSSHRTGKKDSNRGTAPKAGKAKKNNRLSNAASWDPHVMSVEQHALGFQSVDVGRDPDRHDTSKQRNVTMCVLLRLRAASPFPILRAVCFLLPQATGPALSEWLFILSLFLTPWPPMSPFEQWFIYYCPNTAASFPHRCRRRPNVHGHRGRLRPVTKTNVDAAKEAVEALRKLGSTESSQSERGDTLRKFALGVGVGNGCGNSEVKAVDVFTAVMRSPPHLLTWTAQCQTALMSCTDDVTCFRCLATSMPWHIDAMQH